MLLQKKEHRILKGNKDQPTNPPQTRKKQTNTQTKRTHKREAV